jgi:hypothetical protein
MFSALSPRKEPFVFSVFMGVILCFVFFGGQSAVVLIATHEGVNYAFSQISGPRDLQWQFRKALYRAALAFCLLIIVCEIVFYLVSR